jgi:hypothetical protein
MTEYKIIGITKNFIASVDHLETPYFLLLLENDKKYLIKKSFKEYQIGDTFFINENIEKENKKNNLTIFFFKFQNKI